MVIEVCESLNYVRERKPCAVPLCKHVPAATLQVYVNDQIEEQFEKLQRQFDIFCGVQKAYNFGEPEYPDHLQDGYYPEF